MLENDSPKGGDIGLKIGKTLAIFSLEISKFSIFIDFSKEQKSEKILKKSGKN